MGESSDDDDQILESDEQIVEISSSDRNEGEASGSNQSRRTSNDESAYYIYRPPIYILPPYQDPRLSALDLREQIKVICSYHTQISRSIAKQASIQIDSCSYPEPIDPVSTGNNATKDGKSNQGCGGNSEEYVLKTGRITKRKFYAETDENIKEGGSDFKESAESDTLSKKKATLTQTRSKNPRQKQLFTESTEEADSERRTITKTPSASTSTRQQSQRRGIDGFIEPAAPGASKKTRKTVQCPICGLYFPDKEVEQHASSCGEIPVEVANVNLSVTGFRCQSCQAVMDTLVQYEVHRTQCNGGSSHF